MELMLKAGEGPLKDQVFTLSNGLTIGRAGTDITIPDGRVSTLHARVALGEEGQLLLIDNQSKNGVRVNGERTDILELKPGVEFYIGDQFFRVEEAVPTKKRERPKRSQKQRVYWHEALAEFLHTHSKSFKDRTVEFELLEPALVLEFVRGVQVNCKWVLGYGPRKIGAASLDLPIWEPGAPHVCFEVKPTADGLLFQTKHPEVVRLSDQSVDSQVLRVGDTIKINDTIIEVDFVE
jgi:hypothetical protein